MSLLVQDFYKATITRNWTATVGDFNVSIAPTVVPGIIVISPNSSTSREIIKYTAVGTNGYGPFVTVSDVAHRGLSGTTAQSHIIGESVRMNITAEHWEEMQDDINSIIAAGLPAGTDGQIMVNNGGTWEAGEVPESLVKTATITLSSADILDLYNTPKQLVAAPGAGKIIIPEDVVFSLTYGSATYTAGGVVRVSYAGETTQLLGTTNIEAGVIEQTANAVVRGNFIPISTTATNLTVGIDKALQLANNTAVFTTGNSTLKVLIKYRILTL